jgi:hypothetical protein
MTVAALTPEGHTRVDELLAQLAEAAGTNRAWLVRFAKARQHEADLGRIDVTDVEPALMLSQPELDALNAGFMTIRDTEQLDDVANWANAVLALLRDIEDRLDAR